MSQVITILKDQECAFAVKSGGHGMNRGASNIEDGVLIDLGRMNKLDVSEDEATVSIGTGARWGDVYLALQERGLVVVGGRVASVGVGGLILGGTLIHGHDRQKLKLCKAEYHFTPTFMGWLVITYATSR